MTRERFKLTHPQSLKHSKFEIMQYTQADEALPYYMEMDFGNSTWAKEDWKDFLIQTNLVN
jgi:hypothetical protein